VVSGGRRWSCRVRLQLLMLFFRIALHQVDVKSELTVNTGGHRRTRLTWFGFQLDNTTKNSRVEYLYWVLRSQRRKLCKRTWRDGGAWCCEFIGFFKFRLCVLEVFENFLSWFCSQAMWLTNLSINRCDRCCGSHCGDQIGHNCGVEMRLKDSKAWRSLWNGFKLYCLEESVSVELTSFTWWSISRCVYKNQEWIWFCYFMRC